RQRSRASAWSNARKSSDLPRQRFIDYCVINVLSAYYLLWEVPHAPTGEPGGTREAAAACDRTAPGRRAGPCRGGSPWCGPALRAPMEAHLSPARAALLAGAPRARTAPKTERAPASAVARVDHRGAGGGRVSDEPVDLSPTGRPHSPALSGRLPPRSRGPAFARLRL